MTMNGIDVSKWQGTIDWNKVKSAGVEFAIIRAGYGREISQKDVYFEKNYSGAKAAGVPVGAYWYSYATTVDEAKKEAETCLEAIKGKQFEFPVWFDQEYEPKIKALTDAQRTAIVKAFCDTLENAGYYTGLYCSRDWLVNYLNSADLANYDIWVAAYGSSAGNVPLPYGMWQYTSSGLMSGISGKVDMNYSYKDYPTIIKNAGLNGYGKTDLYKIDVDPMTAGDVVKFKILGQELGVNVTSKKV